MSDTSTQLTGSVFAQPSQVTSLAAAIDDTTTNSTEMMAAIAAIAQTLTYKAAFQLSNFKILLRQAVGKQAPGPTDTMDFARADFAKMVPLIATTLPAGITTIKAIKTGEKRTLTAAQISSEAVLLMHDAAGTSWSDVELSVAGSTTTWRVTKDADAGTYTVATSTDGGSTFTTIQQHGADRTFNAGESFTSSVGDYEASFTFNDTIVNVGASSAVAAGDPFLQPLLP